MTALGLLLQSTERRLARAGIPDARLEADLIWMTALDLDRTQLYGALRDTPTPEHTASAEDLIARRLRHEPAAYLMGRREFYGLDLHVAPGVLIPRQDTETLVEEALRLAWTTGAFLSATVPSPSFPRRRESRNVGAGPTFAQGENREALRRDHGDIVIADVGCGSGAIAIALAVHLPAAAIYAVDVSIRALEVTALNAKRHGVDGRIRLLQGDLLAPLPGPVHLITANLPYVMSAEIPTLDPEIRLHEPREALDGGDDGLDLVRRLLTDASAHLMPHGAVLLEMDPRQIVAATHYAAGVMPSAQVRAVRDLAGRERVLVVET
ncbi:MAG: HemK/PrmC family methyltransferase [Dehalococcoidia bacterium]